MLAAGHIVYVENIMNERLIAKLKRMGFETAMAFANTASMYKLPEDRK